MKDAQLSTLSKALRKPWYLFWRIVERLLYQGRSYTLQLPYGHRTFTPWFETTSPSEFAQILKGIRQSGPVAVSPDRCYMLYNFVRRSVRVPGHVAECGVYTGGTAQLIAWLLRLHALDPRRFHLFDTFSGMPGTSVPQRDYHAPGDFADTSLERVKERLNSYSSFCEFHPGLMPDTFAAVADVREYSFVHVDVDIYTSVMECCKWFWPRMSAGGVIVFDDYGFYPYRFAARAAVDEYFSQQLDQPLVMPTGQAVVIKSLPVRAHGLP